MASGRKNAGNVGLSGTLQLSQGGGLTSCHWQTDPTYDMCGKGLHELSWCSQLCNGLVLPEPSPRSLALHILNTPYSQHPKAYKKYRVWLSGRLSPNRGTGTQAINIVTTSSDQQTMNNQDLQTAPKHV